MEFQVHPMWIVAGILSFSSGVLMMLLRPHFVAYEGRAMSFWGASCLFAGTAFGLSAWHFPLAVPIATPMLGAAAMALQYMAVTELKQQKRQPLWVWVPLLLTCAVYVLFGVVRPNMTIGLIAFNLIRMAMMVRIALSFDQKENGRRQFVDVLAACVYVLLAMSTLVVVADFLRNSPLAREYDLNSGRTVYNVAAMAVSQSLLVTLFLLSITERLNLRFKEEARHDSLTGLFNRRAIEDIAYHQKALSLRMGQSFSVFMVDVDRFKGINDAYGHEVGDFILRSVALALRRGLRNEDYLGRWGGDEFCVLLPGTTREQAELVAERVMAIFETLEIEVQEKPIALSISMGAASVDHSVGGFDVLLKMADQALYRAKEQGRRGYAFAEDQKVDRPNELNGSRELPAKG